MLAAWEEMGRMLSWSSMTRHFLQEAKDRINLRNKTTIMRCGGKGTNVYTTKVWLFFREIIWPQVSEKARESQPSRRAM